MEEEQGGEEPQKAMQQEREGKSLKTPWKVFVKSPEKPRKRLGQGKRHERAWKKSGKGPKMVR